MWGCQSLSLFLDNLYTIANPNPNEPRSLIPRERKTYQKGFHAQPMTAYHGSLHRVLLLQTNVLVPIAAAAALLMFFLFAGLTTFM